MMLNLCLILSAVCAIGFTKPLPEFYSYSLGVGEGTGNAFSTAHEGWISGIRVWEYPNNYITGIQLRYESNWTTMVGSEYGNLMEMELYEKEAIIQLSGKFYSGYIYELMFLTNQMRSFKVGVSVGTSFNFYPTQRGSQLRFLSGRQNGWGITSIGAHWAMVHIYTMPEKLNYQTRYIP